MPYEPFLLGVGGGLEFVEFEGVRAIKLYPPFPKLGSMSGPTPIFIARQADSHESLEFPIRTNHPIRANRANRFARITPLRV